MSRMIFVNLPVLDLTASISFYQETKLDSHSLTESVMQGPIKGTSFDYGNESTVIKWKV